MRTRVKICGLTRTEDALLAAELGADALGFIFAPSKRQLDPMQAAMITAALPPWVSKVGVFGPEERERAAAIAADCRLDTLQLHGEPDADFCAAMRERFSVVQALGVGEDGLEALQRRMGAIARHVDAILLDTARPGQLGGTGETFDWSLLPQLQSPVPIMVAGGLNAGNLPTLLRQARPWGVDVASGVESAPGIKEATLLRRFFAALREEPTPTA